VLRHNPVLARMKVITGQPLYMSLDFGFSYISTLLAALKEASVSLNIGNLLYRVSFKSVTPLLFSLFFKIIKYSLDCGSK